MGRLVSWAPLTVRHSYVVSLKVPLVHWPCHQPTGVSGWAGVAGGRMSIDGCCGGSAEVTRVKMDIQWLRNGATECGGEIRAYSE